MLLIKFGSAEHLEQLRNGIVHFSTLETFQEDPTKFRGDRLDGRLLLEPGKPFIINGHDFSSYIKEAVISYDTDCPQLSFSASMLSKSNCFKLSNGLYSINENFVEEMKQFGDYYLIINAFEFIDAVTDELEKTQCYYEYHKMAYIDKNNHQLIRDYFAKLSSGRRKFGHLFIKDTANSCPLQNEWRLVAFDIDNRYCAKGCKGTNIKTGFSTQMPILETERLTTLRCSENFLFD